MIGVMSIGFAMLSAIILPNYPATAKWLISEGRSYAQWIVKTLGYGSIETPLITSPVQMGTFFVSLVVTYTSGRTGDRSIRIILLTFTFAIGNVIVVSTTSIPARFFAMFLVPIGAVS